ncbi:pimeloyl-ACP methyl ester esterase BioH [Thalassotalea sp. G2M2-11]|uniref:pimeloyl-ACP methyl ester esterase BioH n=1 Tax=Thalassotalea sp. G2M2-11 TaxID=2787627 RepID=UPI001F499B93|nr:pimeloyl-ACP methyl ester esterase BioH [Thalassotalea sp. G2M2-11]
MLKISSVGEGIPLVFIHGWGLNSGVWQPSVEQLQQKFQVITVDLPGFGLNVEAQVTPYTIETIAQQIVQSVDQPAVYIGWSLGGLVATHIAYHYPKVTKGLVTIASTPYFVKHESWPGIEANVLQLFHRQLSQNIEKTIDNFLKIQAMGSPHIRQDIKQVRQLVMQYPMPTAQTLDTSLQFLEQVDQRELLASIQVPFLRMYGKLDGLVPKAVIPLIDQLSLSSEHYIFNQASHAPFISDLVEFVEQLTGWLERHI